MSTEAENQNSGDIPEGPGQETAAAIDDADTAALAFPVVGIGASAGGIQAVSELLTHMPADSGMALVVVQHLPPDHQSLLPEILSRHTQMPAREIEDGMELAPNTVYVIRPALSLTLAGDRFALGEPAEARGRRRPIDDFFRSLAQEQREKAIAIVLSGAGTDGTSGAQAIKAAGGVCIAQDPETADFAGMPRSLISSGYADHVCKVVEMPGVLLRYVKHPNIDPAGCGQEHVETVLRPDKEYLAQIFAILRTRSGHSFNGYKGPTVLRRIQRRMGLLGLTSLHAYTDHLRDHLEETRALANDLMINVTGFCRDPQAWEALRTSGLVSTTLPPPGRRDLTASLAAPRNLPMLAIQQALLDQVGPATIVVDRTDRIVYFSNNTTPYVIQPSGEPTRDVFEMLKPSLRSAARTALRRAAANGELITMLAEIGTEESPRPVHLTAAPLSTTKPPEYFRLAFSTALATLPPAAEAQDQASGRAAAPSAITAEDSALEDELRIMRRELQSTVEAFETSNEELKASHEEVVSINEELRSANQELETGKEGLQSLNEELITVNAQLQAKIAELEATTNDLSNLLSSTNIAVVFLDTQLRVRRFTPAVYDLLELIPGDIGRPIANLAQKFVGGGLIEDARAVLSRLIPIETEVLSNSGSWYLRRTLPYRTADNHIDGVVITFVDFSARRRAEQALETSQARLQAILDQLPVAMLMVDAADGTLLNANAPAAELMNLPYPVPTIGSEWQLAAAALPGLHPDGRPYRAQDWPLARSLADSIAIANQEIEFRYADGSRGVLSMSSTPVVDAQGKMVVAVATMFDITQQRRAAERLRESEQRLQLLIDSALDYAIFMLDLDNRIISWNRGAERLLGWAEAEALDRSGTLIFTPEDRGAGVPEQELESARRDGQAVDERVHLRKNGERFWANGMLMSVYDEKGTLCSFAKIIRDETARKRAEEDLQRALHEAERVRASAESANRSKDEFISTISHELRTPLNTIRLWARMLGSERLPEQDRMEGVKMIDRAAEAQQHLIDDLLDVSRMSSGQLRLNLRVTRLADVVRSAIESVRPSADVRKLKIHLELSEDVGLVRADPERMQQVLLNLVSNAVKFTPGGGRIDVQMSRSGDNVTIVVKDTGIGIRAEFLPHVFERFQQAEVVTTRQHGGLGLGLAIVKQLVELHGGSIVVHSNGEGKGATFTASLPLPKSSTGQYGSPANRHSLPDSINNLRVLLVEDDSGSRLATCRALELRGAEMDSAANASQAMASYTQSRPDAMIVDIGLPGEDGYSLIARLREFETSQQLSRVPAIALTAFARTRDRERALAAGFDEHLAKPVDIDNLVAAILRLTRRVRS